MNHGGHGGHGDGGWSGMAPRRTLVPPVLTDLTLRLQRALGDSYVVERELGMGAMSRVFLATERSLNRRVAIKLLRAELLSEVGVQRFRREIDVAAHLQHPHILPVLGT